MVRLESFLADLDPAKRYDAAPRLRAWRAARFDGGGIAVPAPRPAPRPPSDKRPAKLSISEVGTWLRDPYAIYATHVLRLRPAKTYDEPFGPSHRGDFLHGLLEEFIRYQIEDPDDDIKGRLELLLPDIADRFAIPESVRFLNRRFVDNAFKAFGEFEEKARAVSEPLTVEAKGEVTLSAEDREVVVRGRADRLDLHADGVHVIDYKSGGKASVKEDRTFSPQLFLTALMVERGGFPGIAAQPCWQVSFVKLNQYEDVFCKPQKKASRFCRGDELKDALADFETKLTDWLSLQYREETPFHPQLHPYRSDIMGDYDELSRRLEWMREAADE